MALLPLPTPEVQFLDANGHPYAGGTVTTYIPGTDTLKDTHQDLAGTALNTNPIVLDAAGRALIYGAGDYRFVLKDASGNLIYDQETAAIDTSTLVTMTEVNDAVQTETDRAMAAEGALTTNLNTTNTNLAAETTRAEAAEAAIQHQLGGGAFQSGQSVTNSSGYDAVTFFYHYGSVDPFVLVQAMSPGAAPTDVTMTVTTTLSGFQVWAGDHTGTGIPIGYMWLSFGTY